MDWAWRFGMTVFSGVPAIIGGGITYGLTESYPAVIAWEILVVVLLITALVKRGTTPKDPAAAHHAH